MWRKTYPKDSSPALLDELKQATGFPYLLIDVGTKDGETIVTIYDDVDSAMAATIDATVAAHDAAVFNNKVSARETRFQQDLLVLRNRYNNTQVPWEKSLLRVIRRLLGELVDD